MSLFHFLQASQNEMIRPGMPMAMGTAKLILSDLLKPPDDEDEDADKGDGDVDRVLFEGAVVWLAAGLPEDCRAPEVVDGCT